ncbi:MAG: hypothetical protein M3Q06_03485, partial [Bacteroidota bacterium]|nr:hypothetical protein [Bacteroidota bacterium]
AYDFIGSEPAADTVYRVIRSEAVFNEIFRATDASARRPGFSGQTVVAILLKEAPAIPLQFTKAEVAGYIIHVYAQPCSSNNCGSSRVVLATIPNVGSARSVRFFVGGESKAVVTL